MQLTSWHPIFRQGPGGPNALDHSDYFVDVVSFELESPFTDTLKIHPPWIVKLQSFELDVYCYGYECSMSGYTLCMHVQIYVIARKKTKTSRIVVMIVVLVDARFTYIPK